LKALCDAKDVRVIAVCKETNRPRVSMTMDLGSDEALDIYIYKILSILFEENICLLVKSTGINANSPGYFIFVNDLMTQNMEKRPPDRIVPITDAMIVIRHQGGNHFETIKLSTSTDDIPYRFDSGQILDLVTTIDANSFSSTKNYDNDNSATSATSATSAEETSKDPSIDAIRLKTYNILPPSKEVQEIMDQIDILLGPDTNPGGGLENIFGKIDDSFDRNQKVGFMENYKSLITGCSKTNDAFFSKDASLDDSDKDLKRVGKVLDGVFNDIWSKDFKYLDNTQVSKRNMNFFLGISQRTNVILGIYEKRRQNSEMLVQGTITNYSELGNVIIDSKLFQDVLYDCIEYQLKTPPGRDEIFETLSLKIKLFVKVLEGIKENVDNLKKHTMDSMQEISRKEYTLRKDKRLMKDETGYQERELESADQLLKTDIFTKETKKTTQTIEANIESSDKKKTPTEKIEAKIESQDEKKKGRRDRGREDKRKSGPSETIEASIENS